MELREKIVRAGLIGVLAFSGCGPRRTQTVPEHEMKPLPLQPVNTLMVKERSSSKNVIINGRRSEIRPTWQEVQDKKINSLDEILFYLNSVVETADDKLDDYWQSAKATIERGKGDCEDFAILGAYLGEKLGYEPILLDLREAYEKEMHIVTLLKQKTPAGERYGAVNMFYAVPPECNSIEEVVERINMHDKRVPYRRFIRHEVYPLNDIKSKKGDWGNYGGNLFELFEPEDYQRNEEIKSAIIEIDKELEKSAEMQKRLEKMAEESDKRLLESLNKPEDK